MYHQLHHRSYGEIEFYMHAVDLLVFLLSFPFSNRLNLPPSRIRYNTKAEQSVQFHSNEKIPR